MVLKNSHTKFAGTIKVILLLSFFCLSLHSFAQKWDRALSKADDAYDKGDYSKAVKHLTKFKKKVSKKLGQQNDYIVQYHIREARYHLTQGVLTDFEESLNKAIALSEEVNEKSSIQHAANLTEIAKIYVQYGHYVMSMQYIQAAEAILAQQENDYLKDNIYLTKAKTLTGQGYYEESLELLNTMINGFDGSNINKETFVEDGKIKTRRLSDEEVQHRLHHYASLLTLKANTFRKKGNYLSADSAFLKAESWISSELGKADIHYVYNQYLLGVFLIENGLEAKMPKETRFDKTLNNLKKQHEASHFLAFDLYQALLKQYQISGDRGKYRSVKKEYEKAIKKNFKKKSLHYINLEAIEFDAKLAKDRTQNLAIKAASIINNTKSLPKTHQKTIEILDFLYRLALQEENLSAAETNLRDILNIKEELYGKESPEYHLAKLELAHYYLDYTSKIKEAEAIYNESFFSIVKPQINPWHKDYINILNHIALLYKDTDQYQKAKATLETAKDAARSKYQDNDPAYGEELNKIAMLNIEIGEYEEAGTNINKALSILEEYRKDERHALSYVSALETQAELQAIFGLFDETESILAESKKWQKKVDALANYNDLRATEKMVDLYITLGKYSESEDMLTGLISKYESRFGPQSRKLIGPLVSRGQLELINGQYPEAETTAKKAYDIAVKIFGAKSSKTTAPLMLLSEVHTSIGDYEKAEEIIQEAIDIEKTQFGDKHIKVGQLQAQLAIIKFYDGDQLSEVADLIEESKHIIEAKLGNQNPQYAKIITEQAKVNIAQKKYNEAFQALAIAQNIWESKVGRRNNINAASIYTLTGDVYYYQGKYNLAEENYNKSKKLYEKFFNNSHPEYVKVLSKLSKVYFMEGDTKASRKYIEEALANYRKFIKTYFPALSEREKAKYWNTIRPDFEFYNTLAFNLKDQSPEIIGEVYNNALLTKAILLNSSLKIRERIMNSTDTELKAAYHSWLSKKELLTDALSMSTEQLMENEIDPIILSREVDQLEKELSQKSELFSSNIEEKTIEWHHVQQALKPNEIAIEMLRYRHFDQFFSDSVIYAAMYIKHKDEQKEPAVVLISNGHELEGKYFKFYRNSIIYQIRDPHSYDIYWKPIKEVAGAYPTIYLSADGVYNQINLEAIPTPDNKYVIDNSNIILVSNTKDIYLRQVTTQVVQKEKSATMFGNPEFYTASAAGAISPLPGTAQEVNSLKSLLKNEGWTTNSYTEMEAKEEQIKRLDNPKIFHIATHGFFKPVEQLEGTDQITRAEMQANQNPLMRTGLLLTGAGDLLNKTSFNYNLENGILTAYEAMSLNFDQTELVVLSACETGLGELEVGEGVFGLQRAFLAAGAKSLIMSMFKVDDAATQALMSSFYKNWLENGSSKRQAFVDAKKELRTQYPDPIYWGAFIMIGLD
ncbi:CHAT domain-containing protein [Fulvivirga maritima]|uniref:CHAT domain-containing protein n=1 Tax=Fulvivirga maritima TaxID=2904247 RepID=UPI001F374813|nr:CHAT domain-containing protein [Fulvivirga maritima]UII29364.1 CHAT domain-containing protein [Fulvivirga maritima]